MRSPTARSLGLGLVGCGRFGAFCLDAAADLPGSEVVAVTDVDAGRAATLAREHGARPVTDLDALLADAAVDVVIVATPPFLHASITRAAVTAGKDVFCEKPLGIDLASAVAAVEASERYGRSLTVDYVMRWNPLYWLLRRLQELRSRDGAPLLEPLRRYALENLASHEPVPAGHWFWDRGMSGGIFVEHGVHFFDIAAWLAGSRPLLVQAVQVDRGADRVDTVIASAVHPGGATASYHHAFNHVDATEYQAVLLDWGSAHALLRGWIPVDLELDAWTDDEGADLLGTLLGDAATALAVPCVRPSGRERIDLAVAEVAGADVWRAEAREVTRHVRARATLGGQAAKRAVYRESVRAGLADLLEAVQTGRPPRVSSADACESLATALAAQEAADARRTIEPQAVPLGMMR